MVCHTIESMRRLHKESHPLWTLALGRLVVCFDQCRNDKIMVRWPLDVIIPILEQPELHTHVGSSMSYHYIDQSSFFSTCDKFRCSSNNNLKILNKNMKRYVVPKSKTRALSAKFKLHWTAYFTIFITWFQKGSIFRVKTFSFGWCHEKVWSKPR